MIAADPDRPVIEVQNLTRRYVHRGGNYVTALDNASLSIYQGELVCVVGRSGHGKTTLLDVIAGFVRPSSGTVLVEGAVVTGPGPDRGVVFQEDSVFPWMRVAKNVEFGLKAQSLDRETRRRTIAEYLELVGLSDVANSWPRELSGGMRARVAVAGVFANNPLIMLADEPFGALDYVTRRQLQRTLLDMWERTRKTILFVTHDIDEALTLGTRLVVLSNGRIVEDRPITLPRPRTDDVLASDEALQLRHVLLDHLGLESDRADHEVS